MSDILVFKSAEYLHFKSGRFCFSESHENDSKRVIMIRPNKKVGLSHDVDIYKGEDETISEEKLVVSINQMRIMEKNQNRIVLQDWDEDEETCLPIAHYGLIINYKENEVFNCILNCYDKGEDYVYLNESELINRLNPWTYDLYKPDKNGVFTERLMNNHSIRWTFENNQKHGKWKALLPNGTVEEEGFYKNGKPDGEYFKYGGEGHIRYTGNYIQGRRTGRWKYYNNDGIIQLEGDFYYDKEVGGWLFYNSKGELERTEDYGEKGKQIFFKDCGGAGNIICRDCGYKERISSHLHGLSTDLSNASWTSGYQCQQCGKLQKRTSTPSKRDIDLACECGGQIALDKPLFCPKCKSFNVEYHMTFIT